MQELRNMLRLPSQIYIERFVFLVQFPKNMTILSSTGTHDLDFSLRRSCHAVCFTQTSTCCRSLVFCAVWLFQRGATQIRFLYL
jgi:hypothetical protein